MLDKIKKGWSILSDVLVPKDEPKPEHNSDSNPEPAPKPKKQSKADIRYRQFVLDKIKDHFEMTMEMETTCVSLLFHTSMVVYIREENYLPVSQSFALTVRDAVTLFMRKIREEMKNYPDYRPHTHYWELKLVKMGKDVAIDGIESSMLEECPVIIRSKLAPAKAKEKESVVGEEPVFVGTVSQTRDSSGATPCDIDLSILAGLTQLDKDSYWVVLNLNEKTVDTPQSEAVTGVPTDLDVKDYSRQAQAPVRQPAQPQPAPQPQPQPRQQPVVPVGPNDWVANLTMKTGEFIMPNRTYTVRKMLGNRLTVAGKNGPDSDQCVRINNDQVPVPALEIVRDAVTGYFNLTTYCDIRLNQRKVAKGSTVALPHNSRIMLESGDEIEFTIHKPDTIDIISL